MRLGRVVDRSKLAKKIVRPFPENAGSSFQTVPVVVVSCLSPVPLEETRKI
jgi:hypothetical protein